MPAPAVSALVLGALCLPILAALLARERALRGHDEMEARWFCFARRIQALIQLSPMAWLFVALHAVPRTPFLPALLRDPAPLEVIAVFVAIAAPLGLLPAALGVLANDVALRLGTTEIPRRETLRRSAWLAAAAAVPGVLLALGALALTQRNPMAAACWFAAALAIALACLSRHRKGLGLTPHAVTHGPFRDRLFALAGRADVKLQQLYVLPMRRMRLANAFAVSNQAVMVTDLLLDRLERDEVDAVMAHEIAHLKRGDPLKLLLAHAGTGVAAIVGLQLGDWGGLALGSIAGALATTALSRRIEYATDREALRLGADAGAFVSGLARLARLSHVPARWNRWTGWWVTHPSIEDRARAIGRQAGLDDAEIARRLAAPEGPGEHYALPASIESGGRLFSTPFKTRTTLGNALILLFLAVLAPVAVFAVAGSLSTGPEFRVATVLIALLAGPLACLFAFNFVAVQPLFGLGRPLAQRLGLGADPGAAGWELAGLSPHAEPRIYEGFSNWELGFVRVTKDALEFAGEELYFALPPDRIVECEVADGAPGWIPTRAVRVDWLDDAGDEHALRIAPVGGTGLHATGPRADRLAAAIDAWRKAPRAAGAARSGGLPPAGEVTCAHPNTLARFGVFVPLAILDAIAALVLCVMAGLPLLPFAGPGFVETMMVALATQVFLMLPARMYRDPAAPGGESTRDAARRAA